MAAANHTTSQNALSTVAEIIATPKARRRRLTVLNTDGAITVYIGTSSTVSSTTGLPLVAGSSFTYEGHSASGEVYAIAASGTPTVAILEEFD